GLVLVPVSQRVPARGGEQSRQSGQALQPPHGPPGRPGHTSDNSSHSASLSPRCWFAHVPPTARPLAWRILYRLSRCCEQAPPAVATLECGRLDRAFDHTQGG